jgi:hypothetical protein
MGWKEEALAQGREALLVRQARIGGLLRSSSGNVLAAAAIRTMPRTSAG